MPLEDVHRLLEVLDIPGTKMRLCGGETTAMPTRQVEELVYIISYSGYKPGVITNGYGLLKIQDWVLKLFDEVILDNHGFNVEHIERCEEHLDRLGVRNERRTNLRHFDLDYAVNENPNNKGKKCTMYLHRPTLDRRVLYPCCVMPMLDGGSMKINKLLYDAGWNIDNDDLAGLLIDARADLYQGNERTKLLPDEIHDLCEYRCYHPGLNQNPSVPLTMKPHELICKS